MGFTRNYKNLLLNIIASPFGKTDAEWNAIPNVFDDSTFFTIKDITGRIYKHAWSYSYGLNNNNSNISVSNSGGIPTIGHLAGSQSVYGVASDRGKNVKKLVFGTGTSEESMEDYSIQSIDSITFDLQPKIASYNFINGKLTTNYSCVIRNSSDITINEIGILFYLPYQSSATGDPINNCCSVLLYRKKLDTPIELKADEPQLISFSIAVNYPTDDMLNGITTQLDEIIDGGE